MPHISLSFYNNNGIYFLVFFVMPLVFFYKTQIINFAKIETNSHALSREVNKQLQGVFIIVVVLHHLSQRIVEPGLMILFRPVGYLAVGAFFFISGFGLMKSLKRNHKYLEKFMYKKISKIYIPFAITNIFTIVLLMLYGKEFTISQIIKYSLSINLIDSTLWFIVTILIFYSIFYLSFISNMSRKSLVVISLFTLTYIAICKITNQGGWRYISSLCFLVGIYYAFFEQRINSIVFKNFNFILIISGILFLLTFVAQRKQLLPGMSFISCVIFTIFLFTLFLKVYPCSSIFDHIGNVSLEIYLLHMKLMAFFAFYIKCDSGIWLGLYFIILIFSATLFHKANQLLYEKIVHRPAQQIN
ncbi:acyltransferase family protein [Desulfomarina profundi]|uniref:acyltransferase family protein n=1 Tax=Desulfomarina profundi TaxID=2772557 RepID=UPI001E3CA343|nr:acyltransferase family protein [Desulfomarina profundi]